jgi:methyltransferase (TIGR00027 family)
MSQQGRAERRDGPDSTAERVALWRAMHSRVDSPPAVFVDEVGLHMIAPDEGWQRRPDMDAMATKLFRASIVARARFVEDLVIAAVAQGVSQYVILGAGLDSFVQRRPDLSTMLTVFEIDQPGPQAWKRQRLLDLGFGIPDWLRLVSVDFEAGDDWWPRLAAAGFAPDRPAVVAAIGVTLYLTRDAIMAIFRRMARLAAGSTLVMTFLVPPELADPAVRPSLERAMRGARESGTPFLSFFSPETICAMAHEAGLHGAEHVSGAVLGERYFAGRTDGLRPPDCGEELLVVRC